MEDRYNRFSDYLRKKFGCRVQKICVDAGFSCPNRDGTKGEGGCVYCDNAAFSPEARTKDSIERQIARGIDHAQHRFRGCKYMVYFQAFSNTYASVDHLRKIYNSVREFDDVVALAIGTRPDCVDDDILDLIASYTDTYEVWMEYGLQSIHDETLKQINRGHTCADFKRAYELTRERQNIKICAHVIIGLPDETEDEIMATAAYLGKIRIDGIKIHPLHIIKDTPLHERYKNGLYHPLTLDEYVLLVVKFLEKISPHTVIQRLSADCPPDLLIAPEWINHKGQVLGDIEYLLSHYNTYQGKYCS